jgi:zinc transport system substrate-binding protein
MNKKLFFFSILIVAFLFTSCGNTPVAGNPSQNGKTLKVITTLFPLYDFSRTIGGNAVDVSLLLPQGVDPHSFEPRPSDIVAINEADVFVYTGKIMEPWVSDVLKSVTNPHLTVIDASEGITLIPAVFHDADEPVGSMDPHFWLDFQNDQMIIDHITSVLQQKSDAHKDLFAQNAEVLKKSLMRLDEQYRQTLQNCQTKEIIYGGHYTFGYLAKRYGLTYIAAQGVSPDSEPTAHDLASLVDQIKNHSISTVFYFNLTSPKIAETLTSETGAKLLSLNPAENVSRDQMESHITFLDIMQSNLNNLTIGLQCQS